MEEEKEEEDETVEMEKREGRKGKREGKCRRSVLSEFIAPSNQDDHIKDFLLPLLLPLLQQCRKSAVAPFPYTPSLL
jgi:hypothetical protein